MTDDDFLQIAAERGGWALAVILSISMIIRRIISYREVIDEKRIDAENAVIPHLLERMAQLELTLGENIRAHMDCEKEVSKLNVEMASIKREISGISILAVSALVIADRAGTIVGCSPSINIILGWTQVELIGKNVETLVSNQDKSRHHNAFRKAAAMDEGSKLSNIRTAAAVHKDGRMVPVLIKIDSIGRGEMLQFTAEIRLA